MTRRRSTRNPVRVRAVQFSSRLVGTYGCGQVRHDSGRVRPARFLACGRATAQIGPENSAGCGCGSMFESECHSLLGRVSQKADRIYTFGDARPVYILDKIILDGKKLHRWTPRSTRTINLGCCDKKASSVPLDLNPQISYITAQFHIVRGTSFGSSPSRKRRTTRAPRLQSRAQWHLSRMALQRGC
jgi:hypothetical protein